MDMRLLLTGGLVGKIYKWGTVKEGQAGGMCPE